MKRSFRWPLQASLFMGGGQGPALRPAGTHQQPDMHQQRRLPYQRSKPKFQNSKLKHGGQKLPLHHLEWDVWNALSQQLQASPRAFVQKAQGNIKGGPAPHLQRGSLLHDMRGGTGSFEHVMCTHAGCQQTLMCISPAVQHSQNFSCGSSCHEESRCN